MSLAKNNSIYKFYYYFEDTNLLFSFPVSYEYSYGYLDIYRNFDQNTGWCNKENGQRYNIYIVKCREFYRNIQKSKTDIFDSNSANNKNRTLFVTNFYSQYSGEKNEKIYTFGIQFKDPITNGNAYFFADIRIISFRQSNFISINFSPITRISILLCFSKTSGQKKSITTNKLPC